MLVWGLALVTLCTLVWVFIPYSPLRAEFKRTCGQCVQKTMPPGETFSAQVLAAKPKLLQSYIQFCCLCDQPMMHYTVAMHNHADFLLKENAPMAKMQYTQINFATACERAAFIDMKLFHFLPFQGLDDCLNGKGRMRGVAAKLIPAFDVRGKEMDVSALVTVLAEGAICPSFLMHEDVVWEEIDHSHLRATLTQYGITVSGIFGFDEAGALVEFYTSDRYEENNGRMTRCDWKMECGGYQEINGVKRPTEFRAAWVYPTCEKVYFNCNDVVICDHYI